MGQLSFFFSWKCLQGENFSLEVFLHEQNKLLLFDLNLTCQHQGGRCPGRWWSPRGAGHQVWVQCMGSPAERTWKPQRASCLHSSVVRQTDVDRCVGRCADSARSCMRSDSRACSHQRADGDDDNNNPLTGFRTVCLALATDIGPLVSDCGLQLCGKTAVCATCAKRERTGALLRYTGTEAVGIFSPSAINSSRMRKTPPCDRHPRSTTTRTKPTHVTVRASREPAGSTWRQS